VRIVLFLTGIVHILGYDVIVEYTDTTTDTAQNAAMTQSIVIQGSVCDSLLWTPNER